ncbi:MAG: aminotransferase class IV [Planctomycetota bacterium]|jgi:branched-subunit amino acid aminotransferase/4-amino-4-deoxychorismate lyase
MLVWLNGKYVEGDAATISVFDAGLLHGVGLFETMAARNGRVFRVEAHVQRLIDSARELLLTASLRAEPLAQAVQQSVERSSLEAARVRLTVTGGTPGLPHRQEPRKIDPTILIVVQPPTDYPEAFFTSGVTVVVADGRANPFDPMAGHKTLNYWHRIQALQKAAARKTGEALWFTVSNHLAGGSVSNAFLVEDGALVTPIARGEEAAGAIRSPVLPGKACRSRRGCSTSVTS